jgi:nucleoside phosphorylase
MAMFDHRPLGLVIPTRWEAHDVRRRFGFTSIGRNLFHTEINRRPVILCISGVGRQSAAEAAERLLASGAKELVSMGFCGALVPELHVGDLVTDRIATVDQPARTREERRALTERANAVAVDMETQAVVEVGTRRGVPIRILRVVSDEWEDDLTPLFGKNGSFSRWRIAVRLLNPKVWPLAWQLKKQSQKARSQLAEALRAFAKPGS